MKAIQHLLLLVSATITFCLVSGDGWAQNDQGNNRGRPGGRRGRQGNFDPAQFQQRMLERYRERLEVTDDAEWKAMEPLIQNVFQARLALAGARRPAFGRTTRRNRGESGGSTAPERPNSRSTPAAEELQKAIDAKAPPAEMKAALAKYLEARKAKLADLERAQDALRAVLTSRQEAIAVLSGLL